MVSSYRNVHPLGDLLPRTLHDPSRVRSTAGDIFTAPKVLPLGCVRPKDQVPPRPVTLPRHCRSALPVGEAVLLKINSARSRFQLYCIERSRPGWAYMTGWCSPIMARASEQREPSLVHRVASAKLPNAQVHLPRRPESR